MAPCLSLYYLLAAIWLFHMYDAVSDAEVCRSNGCTHAAFIQYHNSAETRELSLGSLAGGGERKFRLHVPPGRAIPAPAPVILVFHGKGQNASAMEIHTQFSSPQFNNDTVIAYPQGINKQWL